MDNIESKVAHFQKNVRETLYKSANRSDLDELEIAANELYKLMNDNTSDIAAFNLLSDVLKMYHTVRKECLARLGEAELMLKQRLCYFLCFVIFRVVFVLCVAR